MSYLVLARKWRPKTFQDLTGQSHVIGALSGAFQRGHLHHAYLLTGTRGVGKTTIARILAKSFNCETGITATPCGICSACTQIDEGRFPDMLEMDAASHTGVDNIRDILDNAHYFPTMGRFKVYLIDEVHMLSKAAFNAMLKTLEEPPEHVKFILATTDPQKIPPTVLSRCLQFHLRPLQSPQITARFEYILGEESISFEPAALALLAHAAQGSLRDGLSLLDQAIAYGGGCVQEAIVRDMLGIIDQSIAFAILDALSDSNGQQLEHIVQQLANQTNAFGAVLEEVAQQLHRIALIQAVPTAISHYPEQTEPLQRLAEQLHPETVQLLYQIALHGKRDLPLAPDALAGLTMTLLRMLTFRPIKPGISSDNSTNVAHIKPATPRAHSQTIQSITSLHSDTPASNAQPQKHNSTITQGKDTTPTLITSHPQEALKKTQADITDKTTEVKHLQEKQTSIPATFISSPSTSNSTNAADELTPHSNDQWQQLIYNLKVSPMAKQLVLQSAWSGFNKPENKLTLTLVSQHKHLLPFQKELCTALQKLCNLPHLQIIIQTQEETDATAEIIPLDTPAVRLKAAEEEQSAERVKTFSQMPFVQEVCKVTGAQVDADSVRAVVEA